MAYFFNKLSAQSNEFAYLLKYKGKDLEKQICENLEKTFQFVEKALTYRRAYSNLERIGYLVSQIFSVNK